MDLVCLMRLMRYTIHKINNAANQYYLDQKYFNNFYFMLLENYLKFFITMFFYDSVKYKLGGSINHYIYQIVPISFYTNFY